MSKGGARGETRLLTLHRKQSRWKTVPKALTNWPFMGSPHPEQGWVLMPEVEAEWPETVEEGCGERGKRRVLSSEDPARLAEVFSHVG
jgi:hypothetical protein